MTDRQNVEKQNETKIYKQIDVWKAILDTELMKEHRQSQFKIGTTETTEKKTHTRNQTKINIVIHTVVFFFKRELIDLANIFKSLRANRQKRSNLRLEKSKAGYTWRYSIFTLRPIPSHMRPIPSSFRPISYSQLQQIYPQLYQTNLKLNMMMDTLTVIRNYDQFLK